MVRAKNWQGAFVVDDGEIENGRLVETVKTSGKVDARSHDGWLVFPDAYLAFVGNHAIIHPNPTPITKALNETPLQGVDDGS